MRILQLTEAFGGGVFTSLTRLASGLANRGHEVHLAYARRAETPENVAAHVHPGVVLHELHLVRSIDARADIAGLVSIRRLVRTLRPDVVHLHSSKAGVLGRVAAWSSGDAGRTFYSPRGLSFLQEDASPRARWMFRAIERACARFPVTMVACSASEEALIRERLAPRRVVLIENAVDVGAVVPTIPRDDGIVRIGIVGRITFARNPALFARLVRTCGTPATRFHWVGGGSKADEDALRDAGVEVTGWMSREMALSAMSRLDVYLHPSRWEGMPIALIEAQVAGLPAVATDVVGNRDVVRDGETGLLAKDFDGLRRALDRLVAAPDERSRMGRRARELALGRFDLERMVDEHERLYASAQPRLLGAPNAERIGASSR